MKAVPAFPETTPEGIDDALELLALVNYDDHGTFRRCLEEKFKNLIDG